MSEEFSEKFCRAIAGNGWMGFVMSSHYGGAGLGIMEAATLAQSIQHPLAISRPALEARPYNGL